MLHVAAQSDKMLHTQKKLTEKSKEFIKWIQNESESPKGKKSLLVKFDSLLSKMYEAKTDTNYVARPSTQWTLKIRTDAKATRFTINGTDRLGKHYTYEMNSEEKKTLGININYKGLSTSLSVNPAHLTGKRLIWNGSSTSIQTLSAVIYRLTISTLLPALSNRKGKVKIWTLVE